MLWNSNCCLNAVGGTEVWCAVEHSNTIYQKQETPTARVDSIGLFVCKFMKFLLLYN